MCRIAPGTGSSGEMLHLLAPCNYNIPQRIPIYLIVHACVQLLQFFFSFEASLYYSAYMTPNTLCEIILIN